MNVPATSPHARVHDPAESFVPLVTLKSGQSGVVHKVTGGRAIALRLAALGILPGREVRVLKNWGPLIVRLQDNRLALSRSAAQHVQMARPAPSKP